jgi:ribokinase
MILVAGSANLDFVIRTPHIPAPGETVLGHAFQTYPGGKGANQAVACARAGGAETKMLLALGNDPFAAPIEQSLRGAGVALEVVRVADQPTGAAFICVSDRAENAITVASGANHALQPGHLPDLKGCSHLLLQLEIPLDTVTAFAAAAHAAGVQVVLNAAPAQALPRELLSLLDILIVNEGELAAISGIADSIERGLRAVDVPCVVATVGERGCCARRGTQLITEPGFVVTAVDTTAAGDTFCGVLIAAMSHAADIGSALRTANAAAALACTRAGAQSSIPTAAEVQGFLLKAAR